MFPRGSNDDSLSVHLVNLTNPMMMKGPIRELYPVGPQQVSVRLPAAASRRTCGCCVGKVDAKPKVADRLLSLTIPSITDHELIAITFYAHLTISGATKLPVSAVEKTALGTDS